MKLRNQKIKLIFIFVLGFLIGVSFLTIGKIIFNPGMVFSNTNITNEYSENKIDPEDENYFKYFKMFREAYQITKKEFYDEKGEVTSKKLIYGAIKGMLESLGDPYTTFMDPNVTKEFNIDMTATFGGLGIHIGERDGTLTVITPIEDTPAWRAGLKPNDKIIEIEGKSTKGMSTVEAVSKLRGKPGTKVTITILREGIPDPFQITLTREEIKLKTVKSGVIENNKAKYGYLKINEFSMPTSEEFKNHLLGLLDKRINGLIIDLRNNPGGLLSIVINIVNNFIDEGLIVYTRGKLQENNVDYFASKGLRRVPSDLPIVVLINQGSASASEIFAGAMKDTHRAVLVGMKTFGKGSVQKTYSFPEDGSQIKYTVAKYFTPSGICIDKVGLEPDVEEKLWLEILNDEEKNSIVKLQSTNIIKNFIKKNESINEKDLERFLFELKEQGYNISLKSLKWLIKLKKSETELPELYNLEFDNQLEKALQVLDNYKDYYKPLVYYKKSK